MMNAGRSLARRDSGFNLETCLRFRNELPLMHEVAGYVFMHAGINPEIQDRGNPWTMLKMTRFELRNP